MVAIFNYVVSRPKTRLEIQKLEKEIEKLSTAAKTTAESISEIQQTINPLPVYQNEQVLYSSTSDNIGFDFHGKGAYVYRDSKFVPGKGAGTLSYPGGGIVSIDRECKEGRYELYLQKLRSRPSEASIHQQRSHRRQTEDVPSGL